MGRVETPRDLTVRGWWQTLRDALEAFRERDLTDEAAALTYYSVLSIFPGLIVLVSLLGVLGDRETVDGFLRIIDELGPRSAVDAFEGPVEDVVGSSGTAGVALVLGIAGGLFSASGYVGAFMRTSNTIYGVEEERPFWKRPPRFSPRARRPGRSSARPTGASRPRGRSPRRARGGRRRARAPGVRSCPRGRPIRHGWGESRRPGRCLSSDR